jgi:hypothetical protein
MRKETGKHVGPPYEYSLEPYRIRYIDENGEPKRTSQVPANTFEEALKRAKEFMANNSRPSFIHSTGAAPYIEKKPRLFKYDEVDPFGKMEKYNEYRKKNPLPSKK